MVQPQGKIASGKQLIAGDDSLGGMVNNSEILQFPCGVIMDLGRTQHRWSVGTSGHKGCQTCRSDQKVFHFAFFFRGTLGLGAGNSFSVIRINVESHSRSSKASSIRKEGLAPG